MTNRLLLAVALFSLGCGSQRSAPLWPGSKYTEADRSNAMLRALDFIGKSARVKKNFTTWGSDYLYCFYSISTTATDPKLRTAATKLGTEFARQWAVDLAQVPPNADTEYLSFMVYGWLPAKLLGENDERVKPEMLRAVERFSATDFLRFDPKVEPPPSDIPEECAYDSAKNSRGAKVCRKCGRPLTMQTKYAVWMDALIMTYSGDRYGVPLGASYRDVIKWMPAMRPYLKRNQTSEAVFLDTLYSLTHVVYTLNDYDQHLLPRNLLPLEFGYLRDNLGEAIALHDPETMGEFLDALKSFGLTTSDEVIRKGMTYLLETQRPDGSWSAPAETDPYTLYHSAWTGIDGLKDNRWQGESLSFPELRPLLESIRDAK